MTFTRLAEIEEVFERCEASGHPLLTERFLRWPELPERHEAFMIADPSNNVLEFKHYPNPDFID